MFLRLPENLPQEYKVAAYGGEDVHAVSFLELCKCSKILWKLERGENGLMEWWIDGWECIPILNCQLQIFNFKWSETAGVMSDCGDNLPPRIEMQLLLLGLSHK